MHLIDLVYTLTSTLNSHASHHNELAQILTKLLTEVNTPNFTQIIQMLVYSPQASDQIAPETLYKFIHHQLETQRSIPLEFVENLLEIGPKMPEETLVSIYRDLLMWFHEAEISDDDNLPLDSKLGHAAVERQSLAAIINHVRLNRVAILGVFTRALSRIFDEIFRKSSRVLSTFLMAVCVGVSNALGKNHRAPLMTLWIDVVRRMVEVEDKCSRATWISVCLTEVSHVGRAISKQMAHVMKYSRLTRLLDGSVVCKMLVELALEMLSAFGVSINVNTKARCVGERITCFATTLLLDLFRNCEKSREIIVRQLLDAVTVHAYNESIEACNGTLYVGKFWVFMLFFMN